MLEHLKRIGVGLGWLVASALVLLSGTAIVEFVGFQVAVPVLVITVVLAVAWAIGLLLRVKP